MPEEALLSVPPEYNAVLDSLLSKDTSIPADPNAPREEVKEDPKPPVKEEVKQDVNKTVEKEAPKEPVKEVAKTDDDDPPEALPNEGRSEKWKQFTTSYKAKKAELRQLKEQMSEFEGTRKERDELKGKIEELTKQNEELGKIDSLSKLEHHPDFKRKFVEARNASVERMKKFAEIAEVPVDELVATLSKGLKDRYTALDELLSSVPSAIKTKILAEVDRVETIDEERQNALNDAKGNLTRLEEERTRRESEAVANDIKTREAIFDRIASQKAKELGLSETDTQEAKAFFLNNENLERAVEIIVEAKAHKLSSPKLKELQDKLADAEKQLAEYRGATPSLGSGTQESTKEDGPRKGEDYVAYMVRLAREKSGQ